MPVRLHHIVVDAYDLPGLARFWTWALGWKVLSERDSEIVTGTAYCLVTWMLVVPVVSVNPAVWLVNDPVSEPNVSAV